MKKSIALTSIALSALTSCQTLSSFTSAVSGSANSAAENPISGSYPGTGDSSGAYPPSSSTVTGGTGAYPNGNSITVTPSVVCAPDLVQGQSTALNTSNVVAVLYKSDNFFEGPVTEIQAWNSSSDMAKIHSQLLAAQPFQLQLNNPLPEGSYSIALYDASKVQAPYPYDWQKGVTAVGPTLAADSASPGFMDYTSTFVVNSKGQITQAQQLNVVYGQEGDPICENAGTIDPLTIDLGDEPIELSSQKDGVVMDLDGDGTFQQISWFTKPAENVLLVNIANGLPSDGSIGPSQLFGNYTIGPDGKTAVNGYDALAKFDQNGDGLIDENDPIWANLRIWKDLNRNGKADPGELVPLSEAGILSIELPSSHTEKENCRNDAYGNVQCEGHGAAVNLGSGDEIRRKPLVDIGFKY